MSDVLADMQNMMGYQGLVGPNPYLTYQGAIPLPGFYTGQAGNLPPTDATGKPIQSFVDYNNNAQAQYQQALAAYNAQPAGTGGGAGTTLNSLPAWASMNVDPSGSAAQAAGLPAGAAQLAGYVANQPGGYNSLTPQQRYQNMLNMANAQQEAEGMVNALGTAPSGVQGSGRGTMNAQGALDQEAALAPVLMRANAANQRQSTQQGPTPPAAPDLRQAYLNALANPGPVPTYGAAPPQPGQTATGSAQQPSVMASFLAAHPQGGTTGAGGYSNQGFFDTLKQLQGSNA